MVAAALFEGALVVLPLDGGAIDTSLLRPALIGIALTCVLLFRFRTWRWLLPLVGVANALAPSLTVASVCSFGFANRASDRRMVLLVSTLVGLAMSVPFWRLGDLASSSLETMGSLMVAGTTGALGMYTASSRRLTQELEQRAQFDEDGRLQLQEEARRAERTRIAREMHDIVAHKISLVALQAGALEVNTNLEREQVVEAAGLIRSTATTALSELREVLGVLRGDDDEAPLAPQPTWNDVRALVTASQEAGVSVELFDFIDAPVPDTLARTTYRVVQEGLTNIHKHARHTQARVALIGEPGTELVIEVSNVLPQGFTTDLPGARMGLSGIEARVTHAGGTITSGPTDDGRFEVKAVIPWPAT